MSNLIEELGLEEDRVEWYHLAACKNMSINWFYDDYETSKAHAEQVDQICLSCPVSKFCLEEGIANKEYGVWGGVYLNLGRIDKDQNSHKTPEHWKKLRKIHGRTSI